jgi:hypothetical protein
MTKKSLKSFNDIQTWKPPAKTLKYTCREIKKYDGSTRVLEIPSDELMSIQKMINKYLTRAYTPKVNQAFKPNWNYIRTAFKVFNFIQSKLQQEITSNLFLLKVDIKDFFQTITPEMVSTELSIRGFDQKLIDNLIKLCYYKGHLPTGAPTSPILSSIATEHLDRRLSVAISTVGEYESLFSRYADDFLFVFNSKEQLENKLNLINFIISDYGFKINHKKTRILPIVSYVKVMGLVGNIYHRKISVSIPVQKRSQIIRDIKTRENFSVHNGYTAWTNSIVSDAIRSQLNISEGTTKFLKHLDKLCLKQ